MYTYVDNLKYSKDKIDKNRKSNIEVLIYNLTNINSYMKRSIDETRCAVM